MVFESFVQAAVPLLIKFSYLGIALLSFISSSTIFLPVPADAIIIFSVATLGLNPILIGISGGLGSAIGELIGFFVGAGGRHVIEKKQRRIPNYVKVFVHAFKKYGFPVIVLTAFLPFPFDIIGIIAGITGYNLKKFLLAAFIGKTVKITLIAYAGVIGLPAIEGLISFLKTVI